MGTIKVKVVGSPEEVNTLTLPTSNAFISVDPARLKLTKEDGTEGVLLGFRCRDCGVHCFGPATFCQACTSDALEPAELSQQGTLYSYTIVRVPPQGWPGPVPYILGQVELPEGPHVLAEVVDCQEHDLKIGMAVELALRPVRTTEAVGEKSARQAHEVVVYKWRPTPQGPEARRASSTPGVKEKEDTR
jgi:uncharacterized OB-fold protein